MRITKPELNILKQKMLDFCVTPRTAKEIAEKLNSNITTIYNTARSLQHDGYLDVSRGYESKNEPRYNLTIKPIYQVSEEVQMVSNASNVRTFIMGRCERLDGLHLESDRQRRKEQKSSRTHVGISSIYNG